VAGRSHPAAPRIQSPGRRNESSIAGGLFIARIDKLIHSAKEIETDE
jgi:hypothetical protein